MVPPPLPRILDPWVLPRPFSSLTSWGGDGLCLTPQHSDPTPLSYCGLITARGTPWKASNKEGAKERVGQPGRAAAQPLTSVPAAPAEPQGLAKP